MGVSTNGEINYGIVFEAYFAFPWEDHDGIEEWWQEVRGYKRPFELFTPEGNYIDGKEPPREKVDEYFDHEREWNKANPLPVEEINYCSAECPMYMLAVPGAGLTANRGYPCEFNPASLVVTDEQRDALLDFCKEHGIEHDKPPKWYLTSYCG